MAPVAGFALCLAALVVGQIAISAWIQPSVVYDHKIIEDIGVMLTSLTAVAGFVLWRWGKSKKKPEHTNISRWIARLLQAALAMIPVLFGCLYFHLAGKQSERHARTFVSLPPLMYLLTIAMPKKSEKDIYTSNPGG